MDPTIENFQNENESETTVELPVEQSSQFVGRWKKLASKTNWEKGKIISLWREKLAESGAPATQYSDEVWSRLVPDVTPQHVGRLRRTYGRFAKVCDEYHGLYWSHFYAALDWNDAEMWLEGAVQNKWSVSGMRRERWQAQGGDPSQKPRDTEVISAEVDDGFERLNLEDVRPNSRDGVEGPIYEDPDFGDETPTEKSNDLAATNMAEEVAERGDLDRPFESLGELPEDLAEVLEAFKLVILRHKMADWEEISQADMLTAIDALKRLAKARSE